MGSHDPEHNKEDEEMKRAFETIRRYRPDLFEDPKKQPNKPDDEDEELLITDELKDKIIPIIDWFNRHPEKDEEFLWDT